MNRFETEQQHFEAKKLTSLEELIISSQTPETLQMNKRFSPLNNARSMLEHFNP